jgi:hypothetical protein
MMRLISVFACVLLLAACGASDSGDKEKGGVIPQHQLDAMEKAKNLENVLQQSEEQRRKQLESED